MFTSTSMQVGNSISFVPVRGIRAGVALFVLFVISACQIAPTTTIDSLTTANGSEPTIVVMPLDVELKRLTAGGLEEPQAEWTSNAKQYMMDAIMQSGSDKGVTFTAIDESSLTRGSHMSELESLNRAVGNAMFVHHFGPAKLPTKKEAFDWTLGDGAKALRDDYSADYAMFVYTRNSYATGGRMAMSFLAAAAGVSISTGYKLAVVSLVDTDTGDVVWSQFSANPGDVRKPEQAEQMISTMLAKLPDS